MAGSTRTLSHLVRAAPTVPSLEHSRKRRSTVPTYLSIPLPLDWEARPSTTRCRNATRGAGNLPRDSQGVVTSNMVASVLRASPYRALVQAFGGPW